MRNCLIALYYWLGLMLDITSVRDTHKIRCLYSQMNYRTRSNLSLTFEHWYWYVFTDEYYITWFEWLDIENDNTI